MITKFHLIEPNMVDFLADDAWDLLEKSCCDIPVPLFGAEDILVRVKRGLGSFYVVSREGEVVGIFYICWITAKYGRTMNIVGFGSRKLKTWRDDGKAWLLELMKNTSSQNIVTLTWKGFDRLIPEFKPVGVWYEYRDIH